MYEELLMNEEGLTTTANKMIFIGKQILFDEKVFEKQLDRLKDFCMDDSSEIRNIVKEIVDTYQVTSGE